MALKPIFTIIGATASGKTKISVELAKLLNGEIIGLDSRQIYRGMSIGTAQPAKEDMDGIPHHLFGFREASKPISAGEYANLVRERVAEIQSDGKVPIICGGAGLYYRALTKGIFEGSVSDLPTRGRLEQAYEQNPVALLERLKSIDPHYAEMVHINNKKRLIRALEIYEATGKPPSEHFRLQEEQPGKALELFTILLSWDRDMLIERIEHRTDAMLEKGWIEEVKTLLVKHKEIGMPFPALDSIGYRQIQSWLKNKISFEEMREEIVVRTRQFSRRQIQWFRKENINLIVEMDHLNPRIISEIIGDIYLTIYGN